MRNIDDTIILSMDESFNDTFVNVEDDDNYEIIDDEIENVDNTEEVLGELDSDLHDLGLDQKKIDEEVYNFIITEDILYKYIKENNIKYITEDDYQSILKILNDIKINNTNDDIDITKYIPSHIINNIIKLNGINANGNTKLIHSMVLAELETLKGEIVLDSLEAKAYEDANKEIINNFNEVNNATYYKTIMDIQKQLEQDVIDDKPDAENILHAFKESYLLNDLYNDLINGNIKVKNNDRRPIKIRRYKENFNNIINTEDQLSELYKKNPLFNGQYKDINYIQSSLMDIYDDHEVVLDLIILICKYTFNHDYRVFVDKIFMLYLLINVYFLRLSYNVQDVDGNKEFIQLFKPSLDRIYEYLLENK